MYNLQNVKDAVLQLATAIEEKSDFLAELDGKSGDGDLGESMKSAAGAVIDTVRGFEGQDVGALLMKAAMACNKAAPSTMGTLISSGMMAAAKAFKGKESLEPADAAGVPRLFAEAIMARGKAKVGDKTILDALVPMADAVEETFRQTGDLAAAYRAGAQAAEAGAQATAGMLAQAGRAKWIGERARENVDGGAALCALAAHALVK